MFVASAAWGGKMHRGKRHSFQQHVQPVTSSREHVPPKPTFGKPRTQTSRKHLVGPGGTSLYRAATKTNLSDSKRYKLVCIPVVADKTSTAGRSRSCPTSDAGFLPSITLGRLLSFERKAMSGYWSLSIGKECPVVLVLAVIIVNVFLYFR